jgi:hypothetical protein
LVEVLTEEKRALALQCLYEDQRTILTKWRRVDVHSLFLNDLFEKDTDWIFYDYKESECYQNSDFPVEERLFCHCGREVKYQYLLQGKNTKEIIGLSLEHLSEHTGIPQKIAKEVHVGINVINRHYDETLVQVLHNKGFQDDIRWFMDDYLRFSTLSTTLKERVIDYESVDLPLNHKDYARIVTAARNMSLIPRHSFPSKNRQSPTETPDFSTNIVNKPRKIKNQYSPVGINDPKLKNDILYILNAYYPVANSEIYLKDVVTILIYDLEYNPTRLIGFVGPMMEHIQKEYPVHLWMGTRQLYKKLSDEKFG